MTSPARALGTWRYSPEGTRDLRLDLLRGFAVFAMAVDHVGGSSPYHILSGGNRFFVSAAEAFVFISGVTVGMVYGRDPMKRLFTRSWSRSWTLYMVSVWLALAFAGAAALAGIPKGAPFSAEPMRFIRDVATLQRSYYLVEVMLLYTFLMASVPFVLFLVRRGLWWVALGSSVGLWSAYQEWPANVILPWKIVDYQNFPLAAWQLLFVVGILLGHFREPLGRVVARVPRPAGGWLAPLTVVLAALIWLHVTNASVIDAWRGDGAGARLLDSWFDKTSLPLPRLIACALVFAFAWQLTTVAWRPVKQIAGGFLLPLGRSALYAYGVHVLAACALEILIFHANRAGKLTVPESFAIQTAMLATVWLCTRFRVLQLQVRWIGQPPVRTFGNRLRPTTSMLAAGALIGAAGLGAVSHDSGGSLSYASAPANARRLTYNNPVTTVTPPRASLKDPIVTTSVVSPEEVVPSAIDLLVESGHLVEGSLKSEALGRYMPYAIYLPPSYLAETDRRFPVLYLLHGAGGGYTEWPDDGLTAAAEAMMLDGAINEFVIVMPEGEQGYWANSFNGDGEQWEDYLIDDVVPYIDANYRTLADRESRAIGGLSRGGFGALALAFTHPETFSIVGANSPSLPGDVEDIERPLINDDDLPQFDPLELAHRINWANPPQIWLDIGDQDDWLPAVTMLDRELTALDIPHELSIGEGGHVKEYWVSRVDDYLDFYSRAFSRGPAEARPDPYSDYAPEPQADPEQPVEDQAATAS